MNLYKDPKELRSFFRVDVTPKKPAFLVLEKGGHRLEVSDIGAGGFAVWPDDLTIEHLVDAEQPMGQYQHNGTLYLEMDDLDRKVPVPLSFQVVSINGMVRCKITQVDQVGRDRLYTYVYEADKAEREEGG